MDPFEGVQFAGDTFWTFRLRIQAEWLTRNDRDRGIWYVIDQELAAVYFAIDYVLFAHITGYVSGA